jgi:hypothetical protein
LTAAVAHYLARVGWADLVRIVEAASAIRD